MIIKDWKKIKNDQERNLMIRRAQTARIIIICSYCIMALQWTFISVLPIFGMAMRLTSNITDPGKIPMPLQSHYIYDITKSPQRELTFISQAVYLLIAAMVYSGVDNFLSLMVFHVCGQLDILANRMQHLDKYKNYPKVLKRCIEKHIRLLRAINIIEDTYNRILLSLFIYFAIIFAFYGFRIISLFNEGNDMSITHLIYFIWTIINLFAHMCLYCVLGEILVAQCNKIYYEAYNSKWYTMDPKVARDLLLLMKRGSKQICLTVGKMYPVTLATFCSLIKTSVGYISVLHTIRK
ncbi:PREDICTED: odorant receptor 13a-like [Trachymyrmex septentrionalis]|uniref:odorant receptor 13a-like n=1 Tax=Trachymyrmex septentrionalis TaxID=34720 RepID=UPI00084EE0C6|nr:PREDICTED: odorant receptor 13a-like [Trachymyrmex septentrionalis]